LPRGENGWKIYYIAIFPLFAKGGKWLENLLYSHFSTYPGKGEVAVFRGVDGKMALGKNGSITPAPLLLIPILITNVSGIYDFEK
jgi:hypothetical protein